jgi:hypothetical protein
LGPRHLISDFRISGFERSDFRISGFERSDFRISGFDKFAP